jgi:hypothetical protein
MVGAALRKFEEKVGLPPLREITSILSGENGKRIDGILSKLLKLSENTEVLREANRLMQTIQEMGRSGDLQTLNSILISLPRGKTGQDILIELNRLIEQLSSKIDKLSELAKKILSKED